MPAGLHRGDSLRAETGPCLCLEGRGHGHLSGSFQGRGGGRLRWFSGLPLALPLFSLWGSFLLILLFPFWAARLWMLQGTRRGPWRLPELPRCAAPAPARTGPPALPTATIPGPGLRVSAKAFGGLLYAPAAPWHWRWGGPCEGQRGGTVWF